MFLKVMPVPEEWRRRLQHGDIDTSFIYTEDQEEIVLKFLFPWATFTRKPGAPGAAGEGVLTFKGVTLTPEIKMDWKSYERKNRYIETYNTAQEKPSGLDAAIAQDVDIFISVGFRQSELDEAVIFYDRPKTFGATVERLKCKDLRDVGDGNSKGFLVDSWLLEEEAIYEVR